MGFILPPVTFVIPTYWKINVNQSVILAKGLPVTGLAGGLRGVFVYGLIGGAPGFSVAYWATYLKEGLNGVPPGRFGFVLYHVFDALSWSRAAVRLYWFVGAVLAEAFPPSRSMIPLKFCG